MTFTPTDLHELAEIAISAATAAGRMIAESRPADVQHKAVTNSPVSQVVTEVDRRSEVLILDALRPTIERFQLGLLTEERRDDGSRFTADHFWCVDPLDGTLPFIEGTPGYAVSIALVSRSGTPLIGVVYDPVEAALFHAVSGSGAFRDGNAWSAEPATSGDELSVFADRSFHTMDGAAAAIDSLDDIAGELGLERVRVHTGAGAVVNACSVLTHPPACYVKYPASIGGGSLWDFAATACLFREAGAIATDIHGAPLDLNRPNSSFMHHRGVLFATDEQLASRLRSPRPPATER